MVPCLYMCNNFLLDHSCGRGGDKFSKKMRKFCVFGRQIRVAAVDMFTIERKMCAEIRSGRSMGREMIPLSGWNAAGE